VLGLFWGLGTDRFPANLGVFYKSRSLILFLDLTIGMRSFSRESKDSLQKPIFDSLQKPIFDFVSGFDDWNEIVFPRI
jgi:hypothetical protein